MITIPKSAAFRRLRQGWVFVVLLMALLFALAPTVSAEAKWPEKPVRIVLPFGAGGVSDFALRIVADKLSTKFGERFYVENKPGPGGINEALTVLNAPPDGYTMGLVAILNALSVDTFKKLPYNPVTQFEMVSTIGRFNMDFAVTAKSPYKTLGDFIKAAKAHPGKLNIGTVAIGSAQNFGAQLFKSLAKINVVIVPFHRSPDAVVGLLRNDVQMLVDFPPAIKGQVEAGKVRVLATSGATRSLSTPDIPTVAEAGVKGYSMSSWDGLFVPKGTPNKIVRTLNKAIHVVLAMPDVKAKFATVGFEPQASTPLAVKELLKAEIKKWHLVMIDAGIPKR